MHVKFFDTSDRRYAATILQRFHTETKALGSFRTKNSGAAELEYHLCCIGKAFCISFYLQPYSTSPSGSHVSSRKWRWCGKSAGLLPLEIELLKHDSQDRCVFGLNLHLISLAITYISFFYTWLSRQSVWYGPAPFQLDPPQVDSGSLWASPKTPSIWQDLHRRTLFINHNHNRSQFV